MSYENNSGIVPSAIDMNKEHNKIIKAREATKGPDSFKTVGELDF